MKQEIRNFLEELADLYEEWAEVPPTAEDCIGEVWEAHTCDALGDEDLMGYWVGACDDLVDVWRPAYGGCRFPAGHVGDPDRDELRFDFCWYMADTIREALEAG